MSFQIRLQEFRRLEVLRILNEAPGYTASEDAIDSELDCRGQKVSRDVVKAELTWLEEQGLITLSMGAGMSIASITQRGADVAEGQARHPGVRRPRP